MRKLIRIAVAAVLAASARFLVRRLFAGRDDGSPKQPARPAPPARDTRAAGPSRDQLYREAARLEVKGRSKMNKQQLQEAVEAAKIGGSA